MTASALVISRARQAQKDGYAEKLNATFTGAKQAAAKKAAPSTTPLPLQLALAVL